MRMTAGPKNGDNATPSGDDTAASAACPLSVRQQNRNLVRFAVHMSLIYLAAPVVYVGNLDAVLLNKLGYTDKVANLPAAAYLWTTAPFLVLFTWYFCRVRMLKPVLVASYAVIAARRADRGRSALLQPHSNWLVAALVVRATLMGWCLGIVNVFEWEILARGVAEQRRGLALSLAFGFGPILAVLSSFGTQLVLDGRLGPISMGRLGFSLGFLHAVCRERVDHGGACDFGDALHRSRCPPWKSRGSRSFRAYSADWATFSRIAC